MPSRSVSDLQPLLAYAFGRAEARFVFLWPNAPKPFLVCTYRSNEEQNQLFAQVPKVTNAKAGQSAHNFPLSFAFDVAFMNPNKSVNYSTYLFDNFAKLVLEVPGITWGGNFKSLVDKPHFEVTGWEKLVKKG